MVAGLLALVPVSNLSLSAHDENPAKLHTIARNRYLTLSGPGCPDAVKKHSRMGDAQKVSAKAEKSVGVTLWI